jgi:hypothetical protein
MLDLPIASLMARDLSRRQFAAAPRPTLRASVVTVAREPRAPVRRAGARALRALADRVEPAPCGPARA